MAAETFVFIVAAKVLGKIGSPAFQEACLVWGFESDLNRLENTLSTIKAMLLDVEDQQVHNQELIVWLRQLKEVFYDAQDVLDEFEYEALRRQMVEIKGSATKKVRRFFSSSNSLVFRTKIAHKVKEIRARLDEGAADMDKFHLSQRSDNKHLVHGREMSYSFVQTLDVIGRDQDKEQIINCLMHLADDQKVSIISVVGIGGVGKIALAKLVFNDARVVHHFELKGWMCASNEFVLKQLLDDVWNKDRVKWIELRNLLMGGANGSKILVTTRSPTIASMISTMCLYNLKGLPQEQCVSLFIKWKFDEGEERQHANLVEIGEEIVKKCKGVPLAVKSLGSLLYSQLDERDWQFVKDNEIWKLNRKECDIFSALQLSYNQMSSYLKQWLLQSPDENQEPEDIGNQYVDELFSRCFLEDYSDAGYFRLFKIHDLAHDLALSIAQLQNLHTLLLDGCEKLEELPKDIRYMISLRWLSITTKQKSLPTAWNSLRNLPLFNCGNLESLSEMLQGCTCLLRMLIIDSCGEVLAIENCEKLDLTEGEDNQEEFPTRLRAFISFSKLPQLVVLPEWIKRSAKTLQSISIQSYPNLTILPAWLLNLETLKKLIILNCPKLWLEDHSEVPNVPS
ncbi:hypothetical protein ACB098_06G120000 [Castanea mollissima]